MDGSGTTKAEREAEKEALAQALKDLRHLHPDVDLMDLAMHELTEELYKDGMMHMDECHEFLRRSVAGLSSNQRGYLTAQLQQKPTGTIRIRWLKQRPLAKSKVVKGGPTVFSDPIPLKGTRYTRQQVINKRSPSYESAMYSTYEDRFELLREASGWIGKVQRQIKYMRKALAKVADMR